MSKITRFEDLECWQEARKLVQEVYKICRNPNFKKDFRLVGQIQGAAISTMANIPEANKTAMIISGLIKYLRKI